MYKSATQGTLNKGLKVWYKKYSSIPIGWILRLERRGCRFEPCLLYMICSSKRLRTQDFHSCNMSSMLIQITRFVGVTANISDCRSEAMSSILIRTANCWVVQWWAYQTLILMILVRVQSQRHMLALAYLVKHPSVQRKNRVRAPESTNNVWTFGL